VYDSSSTSELSISYGSAVAGKPAEPRELDKAMVSRTEFRSIVYTLVLRSAI
jgi:hypothetical protein